MRIVVAVPLERNVPAESFLHFWEIARRGYPIIHRGYARTDVNRNEFARVLLRSDYTHVVMLDLDHKHPFDIVERLARWPAADRDRFQVVGNLNFRRTPPFNPCMYVRGPDGLLHWPLEWHEGIVQVDGIGHGAMIVDRRVFERLPFPWWQYRYPTEGVDDDELEYPTEDLYFTDLCREHGIEVWCDTTSSSPHMTGHEISANTFREWLRMNPPANVFEDGERKPYTSRQTNENDVGRDETAEHVSNVENDVETIPTTFPTF